MRLKILIPVFISAMAMANVTLPSVIGSGMVLQQNSEVKVWGWAGPGEEILVVPSWSNDTLRTVTDGWARWSVTMQTPSADNVPRAITIMGSDTIVLKNVLLGEVWLCSGQSNMEWNAVRGFNNAEKEVSEADYPNIRLYNVKKYASDSPQEDCPGSWSECSPATMREFSATGYFFGRELHRTLGVPVGLINASWGGTGAEVWTRSESIAADPELLEKSKLYPDSPWKPVKPGTLFNSMIAPLIQFRIAGVIWYQGEENVRAPHSYPKLFGTMINQWRADWKTELPFYYVQIAPYEGYSPFRGVAFRDAQRECMKIPNVGMVVVSDIGNIHNIHPGNKQDVGKRLANWALAKTYGKKEITYSGPVYESMKIEGGRIRLSFMYSDNGLISKGGDLTHFEIAGEDGKFYNAKAKIDGKEILVWSNKVKNPMAVRFAWDNIAEPNLFNQEGLPASAFRTDNWDIIYDQVSVKPVIDFTKDAISLSLSCPDTSIEIRYTMDGSTPSQLSEIYRTPLLIRKSVTLSAVAFRGANSGTPVIRRYDKHKGWGKKIIFQEQYNLRYATENKDLAVVDGLRGSDTYRDGMWQGYEGNDMNLTIDLGAAQKISRIAASFLQDQESWIFLPISVAFFLSDDGKNFRPVTEIKNNLPANTPGAVIKEFCKTIRAKARYINVKAKNRGVMPEWHQGRGGKAWIFVDEIVIE